MQPWDKKSQWTLEDYQAWMSKLRKEAGNLRRRAAAKDTLADQLRQEAAKFNTQGLPLFSKSETKSVADTTAGSIYPRLSPSTHSKVATPCPPLELNG